MSNLVLFVSGINCNNHTCLNSLLGDYGFSGCIVYENDCEGFINTCTDSSQDDYHYAVSLVGSLVLAGFSVSVVV